MMAKRIQWAFAFLSVAIAAVVLYAQNPVSISQVGTTPVTTTVPISGTVTANAGSNLNTSALALDATLSTLDTDVKANITLHAGTNVIGHVIADSGSTTAVTQATAANLNAAVVGTGTAGSAAGGVLTVQGVASMTKLLVTPDSVALPANQSVNVAQVGGTAIVANPCLLLVPTTVAISQTASTKLISQTSAKTNYICGGVIVAGAAEIVNIVEGTGSTCGTSTAAVAGSTTAANGMSFAANGGFSINSAIKGTGTNLDLCLSQSGSNRLSGWISYVQQ